MNDTKLWLTLTWDVLKLAFQLDKLLAMKININMRCIEMLEEIEESEHVTLININMRCIEIM